MTHKYCRLCNAPIDVDRRWNGLAYIPEYRSAEPGDPAFGQVIDRCPGCGESATSFRDEGFLLSEPNMSIDRFDESKTRYIMRLEARIAELEAALKNILPYAKATEGRFKQVHGISALLETMHQNIATAQALLEGGK